MVIVHKDDGYTLIEILIVLVIIGIIAAIAYPNLIGLTDSSKNEVVNANMRTLLSEIEVYNSQNDGYPELETEEFINNPEGWNSLEQIVDEIGNDSSFYVYSYDSNNYVFSVKLDENDFTGISKENGLETGMNSHLEL